MRRTPTTPDTRETTASPGAARTHDFDLAFRELVAAWTAREDLRGDAERIPALYRASRRLDEARLQTALRRAND